eukprot:TRINITY_DN31681_c0_g1_i1.p3 TRINITY_DN31681_c0_g1~~TRINITY_DN31681_c0_g1_i1.p3  ORF type:complete len:151 (+),score=34.56 TRINITY_DN31681_c0_g1_i1:178-630(+)
MVVDELSRPEVEFSEVQPEDGHRMVELAPRGDGCSKWLDSGMASGLMFLTAMLCYLAAGGIDAGAVSKSEGASWLELHGAGLFVLESGLDIVWCFWRRRHPLPTTELQGIPEVGWCCKVGWLGAVDWPLWVAVWFLVPSLMIRTLWSGIG